MEHEPELILRADGRDWIVTVKFPTHEIRGRIRREGASVVVWFDKATPPRLERQTLAELLRDTMLLARNGDLHQGTGYGPL